MNNLILLAIIGVAVFLAMNMIKVNGVLDNDGHCYNENITKSFDEGFVTNPGAEKLLAKMYKDMDNDTAQRACQRMLDNGGGFIK